MKSESKRPETFRPYERTVPLYMDALDGQKLNLEKAKGLGQELAYIAAFKVLTDFVNCAEINPSLVKWAGDKFLANALPDITAIKDYAALDPEKTYTLLELTDILKGFGK